MASQEPRRIWTVLEDAFILVSVLALWPGILKWEGAIWESLQYIAVAGLIWIFVRRVRRYQTKKNNG
jgi:hypothetical protein